ncbi:MAG: FkbM family methyltransferase [Rhodospirillales bacterium]|nr:FkbM family methyltransferase [Rhodospirillales bacterium]
MKKFILSLLDRPFPGALIGGLFGFLRHRPTVMGLKNPLHVSHYFIDRNGARYLARADTYLALEASQDQIVRFDPGTYEPEIAYLIQSLVKPEDTAIDIGANVGLHTAALARAAHQGHVYAFEPVAEMAEQASLNCALNGLDNVTLFHCALGEETGEAEINVNVAGPGMEGTSSILKTVHVEKRPTDYQARTIPVRRLDDVMAEANPKSRVSFIKIDTEGFEPFVIRGGMATIRRHRPVMIIEAHSARLAQAGLSFQWYPETFPDYHVLISYETTPANPYFRLQPLQEEPPEIAVNLLLLPRLPGTERA